eukprot:gene885-514_t
MISRRAREQDARGQIDSTTSIVWEGTEHKKWCREALPCSFTGNHTELEARLWDVLLLSLYPCGKWASEGLRAGGATTTTTTITIATEPCFRALDYYLKREHSTEAPDVEGGIHFPPSPAVILALREVFHTLVSTDRTTLSLRFAALLQVELSASPALHQQVQHWSATCQGGRGTSTRRRGGDSPTKTGAGGETRLSQRIAQTVTGNLTGFLSWYFAGLQGDYELRSFRSPGAVRAPEDVYDAPEEKQSDDTDRTADQRQGRCSLSAPATLPLKVLRKQTSPFTDNNAEVVEHWISSNLAARDQVKPPGALSTPPAPSSSERHRTAPEKIFPAFTLKMLLGSAATRGLLSGGIYHSGDSPPLLPGSAAPADQRHHTPPTAEGSAGAAAQGRASVSFYAMGVLVDSLSLFTAQKSEPASRAEDVHTRRHTAGGLHWYSTGCAVLDATLRGTGDGSDRRDAEHHQHLHHRDAGRGGGLRSGFVTEICGAAGSGKTQLVLQLLCTEAAASVVQQMVHKFLQEAFPDYFMADRFRVDQEPDRPHRAFYAAMDNFFRWEGTAPMSRGSRETSSPASDGSPSSSRVHVEGRRSVPNGPAGRPTTLPSHPFSRVLLYIAAEEVPAARLHGIATSSAAAAIRRYFHDAGSPLLGGGFPVQMVQEWTSRAAAAVRAEDVLERVLIYRVRGGLEEVARLLQPGGTVAQMLDGIIGSIGIHPSAGSLGLVTLDSVAAAAQQTAAAMDDADARRRALEDPGEEAEEEWPEGEGGGMGGPTQTAHAPLQHHRRTPSIAALISRVGSLLHDMCRVYNVAVVVNNQVRAVFAAASVPRPGPHAAPAQAMWRENDEEREADGTAIQGHTVSEVTLTARRRVMAGEDRRLGRESLVVSVPPPQLLRPASCTSWSPVPRPSEGATTGALGLHWAVVPHVRLQLSRASRSTVRTGNGPPTDRWLRIWAAPHVPASSEDVVPFQITSRGVDQSFRAELSRFPHFSQMIMHLIRPTLRQPIRAEACKMKLQGRDAVITFLFDLSFQRPLLSSLRRTNNHNGSTTRYLNRGTASWTSITQNLADLAALALAQDRLKGSRSSSARWTLTASPLNCQGKHNKPRLVRLRHGSSLSLYIYIYIYDNFKG